MLRFRYRVIPLQKGHPLFCCAYFSDVIQVTVWDREDIYPLSDKSVERSFGEYSARIFYICRLIVGSAESWELRYS